MIYFLVYMFVEIFVSYEFTKIFTPFGMFLEILASAVFGMMLLRTLNFALAENMQKVMRREITQEEFISIGMFKFVGAILLVVPGVFTDILGILMQFEVFGSFVAKKLITPKETYKQNPFESDIIDVEIIEDKNVK